MINEFWPYSGMPHSNVSGEIIAAHRKGIMQSVDVVLIALKRESELWSGKQMCVAQPYVGERTVSSSAA